uniref:CX9C domain-containing protein n=1 Tax=Caenorhabditis tropicalis TaxID=1561998 RepID=A0A1I7TZF6_9PELO
MKILLTILLLLAVANMVASECRRFPPCPFPRELLSFKFCDRVPSEKYSACIEEHQAYIKQHQPRPSKLSYDNCDSVPADEYLQCLAIHRRSSERPVYRPR